MMQRQNTMEEIRKREKKLTRRGHSIAQAERKKKRRIKGDADEKEFLEVMAKALKDDKQKRKPEDKKPGQGKFLEAFSFIPWTPYDRRNSIPVNYRCHSFNGQKQYVDFLKEFIYPYNLPPALLWTALEKETVKDDRNRDRPSPDFNKIRLAKKWICDITSGVSFYKRNKEYFTKAEAHFFLISDVPYSDPSSIIEQYFYAKCLARRLSFKLSRIIARVFLVKFANDIDNPIVTGFLDLIARSVGFDPDKIQLGDICDFVLSEIIKHKKSRGRHPPFSFSGRTMSSVLTLANEWHAYVIREQEAVKAVANARRRINPHNGRRESAPQSLARWNGFDMPYSRIETENGIWIFSQLHTVQDLLNEGRKMKNCVSSYSAKCASGDCAIFHLSRLFTDTQISEDKATLEVSRNRVLVQAKAKCDTNIPPVMMGIIRKWAQFNRIKMAMWV